MLQVRNVGMMAAVVALASWSAAVAAPDFKADFAAALQKQKANSQGAAQQPPTQAQLDALAQSIGYAPPAGLPAAPAVPPGFFSAPLKSRKGLRGELIASDPKRDLTIVSVPLGGKALGATKAGATLDKVVFDALSERANLFPLKDPAVELRLVSSSTNGEGGAVLRFEQLAQGTPVWAHEVVAGFDTRGDLRSLTAMLAPASRIKAPKGAMITASGAIATAEEHLESIGADFFLTTYQKGLLGGYEGPTAELHYWNREAGEALQLVYVVEARPNFRDWYRVFVSAETGAVLHHYNATVSEAKTNVTGNGLDLYGNPQSFPVFRHDNGTYYMIDTTRPMFNGSQPDSQVIDVNNSQGVLMTLDLRNKQFSNNVEVFYVFSPENAWGDSTAVSAHINGGIAYEYFRQAHGRNSLDGNGGTIRSVVHVGENYDNAFWNGVAMAYGDGGSDFLPLARGLDVAVHEMSHGVVQNTADLEYEFQSGALNESFADVFGVVVDDQDYLLGEDVVRTSAFPSGALRNLQNPNNGGSRLGDPGWQPRTMAEYVNLNADQDNGGVHINSGIPNHAAYLVMNAIGRQDTARIWYKALSQYLVKRSNFADARVALERSATDLFGSGSAQHNAVKSAFDQVGIGSSDTTRPPEPAPVGAGAELLSGVSAFDGTLFIANLSDSNPTLLRASNAPLNLDSGAPYTHDPTGEVIFFVGSDHILRETPTRIGGNGLEYGDAGRYSSVAMSPGGTKISLTPYPFDKFIFSIDLISGQTTSFELYHPTTADGSEGQDIVVAADGMSWIDERYLVYDAFKVAGDASGGEIGFWDLNILDVQSGNIVTVFPPQPLGVLTGNPSVASLNNTAVAFDFIDQNESFIGIGVVNLYTGEWNVPLYGFNAGTTPDFLLDDSGVIGASTTSGFAGPLYAIGLQNYLIPVGNPIAISGTEGLLRPKHFLRGQTFPSPDNVADYVTGDNASPGQSDANKDALVDGADVVFIRKQAGKRKANPSIGNLPVDENPLAVPVKTHTLAEQQQ